MNVITESGTNQLHGDVYEYFRNTVLIAQGFFNTVKPQENQNQFGGTFGGPLKKDRTFFFPRMRGAGCGRAFPVKPYSFRTAAGKERPFYSRSQPSQAEFPISLRRRRSNGRPGCDAALGLAAEGGLNSAYVDGGYSSRNPLPWSAVFPMNVIPP